MAEQEPMGSQAGLPPEPAKRAELSVDEILAMEKPSQANRSFDMEKEADEAEKFIKAVHGKGMEMLKGERVRIFQAPGGLQTDGMVQGAISNVGEDLSIRLFMSNESGDHLSITQIEPDGKFCRLDFGLSRIIWPDKSFVSARDRFLANPRGDKYLEASRREDMAELVEDKLKVARISRDFPDVYIRHSGEKRISNGTVARMALVLDEHKKWSQEQKEKT